MGENFRDVEGLSLTTVMIESEDGVRPEKAWKEQWSSSPWQVWSMGMEYIHLKRAVDVVWERPETGV